VDEPQFSLALDAIYDAATAFERWPAALDRIGQAFGCSYVGLIDRNLRTLEGRGTAVGIDPAGQREYFDTWSKHGHPATENAGLSAGRGRNRPGHPAAVRPAAQRLLQRLFEAA